MGRGAYRLTVVAGPNRGTSYRLRGGRISVGRQPGNDVVLPSTQVSKRHLMLIAENGQLVMEDLESANGTFVNGVLTRSRELTSGDRIGVGEYLLEVRKLAEGVAVRPIASQAPIAATPGLPAILADANLPSSAVGVELGGSEPAAEAPRTLRERAEWLFEHRLMPVFYGLNLKHEWRVLLAALLGAFVIVALLASIQPTIQTGRQTIVQEVAKRAQFMAKLLVERNSGFIAAGQESRAEIGLPAREDGVRSALVVDLDNRIIAPAERLNQYLVSGSEAMMAVQARELFRRGQELGFVREVSESMVIAVEPIKVFNPQLGKNATVAFALVSIDASLSIPSSGAIGVIYSQTLVILALVAALLYWILHRLTLKPLLVLNDDIDRVLKGDLPSITREFKFAELNPLFDALRTTLQRVSAGAAPATDALAGGVNSVSVAEELVSAMRALSESIQALEGAGAIDASARALGIALCDPDRRIVYLNEAFENLSGLRLDGAQGVELASAVRDQAQSALFSEHFGRATPGGEPAQDEFEFVSGSTSVVRTAAIGLPMSSARGYLIIVAPRAAGGTSG